MRVTHPQVHNRSSGANGGKCPEKCRNTLVGLASTAEGRLLMECDCAGDEDCERARARLETCGRRSVHLSARNDTVSRWECSRNPACLGTCGLHGLSAQLMYFSPCNPPIVAEKRSGSACRTRSAARRSSTTTTTAAPCLGEGVARSAAGTASPSSVDRRRPPSWRAASAAARTR